MRLQTVAFVLSLLLSIGGCTRDGKWTPDRPRLTDEQRWALVPIDDFVPPPPVPLTLSTTPQVVQSYSTIRVTCMLPAGLGDARYNFGVDGIFSNAGPVMKRELSYVLKTGCHQLQAYCAYAEYKSPDGYQKPVSTRLDIKPIGDCR